MKLVWPLCFKGEMRTIFRQLTDLQHLFHRRGGYPRMAACMRIKEASS